MLAQQGEIILLGIVAVGHVGLVAKVDELFAAEIGVPVAVGIGGVAAVVKAVEADDRIEDGQAAGA
ncbi:MAG: hypothetical protein BWY77_00372 [bacterium ADurb.Bin431]|nr:MAG: hypothetical protein BWY77_00372 [bacterium ADurb.Bin431]